MAYLRAPNGERITATVETVIVTYDILDVERSPDNETEYLVEFCDDGGTVHWDASEQITRHREGSVKAERVYQTGNGDEFLEGDLELVDEEPSA